MLSFKKKTISLNKLSVDEQRTLKLGIIRSKEKMAKYGTFSNEDNELHKRIFDGVGELLGNKQIVIRSSDIIRLISIASLSIDGIAYFEKLTSLISEEAINYNECVDLELLEPSDQESIKRAVIGMISMVCPKSGDQEMNTTYLRILDNLNRNPMRILKIDIQLVYSILTVHYKNNMDSPLLVKMKRFSEQLTS